MTDEPGKHGLALGSAEIIAIAALLAAITFGLAEPHSREMIFFVVVTLAKFFVEHLLPVLLVIAIAASLVAIWRTIAVQARLKRMIPYSKVERRRWHALGELQFGYIPYQPLLREDENNLPIGVGVTLLRELLSDVVTLKRFGRASRWEEIDDQLADAVAVFATPLIATFDRTKSMAFSSPLFFSNMGLFVKTEYADQFSLHGCSHDKMAKHVELCSTHFLAIPGEISQNLAERYIPRSQWRQRIADNENKSLGTLFEEVVNAPQERPLAIFSESIHAHFNENCISGKVVNVLAPGSILYPVCFALRQGDYQLKNLINLRLLELSRTGGVLNDCAEKMADPDISHLTRPISKDEVLKHYVDHWSHVS